MKINTNFQILDPHGSQTLDLIVINLYDNYTLLTNHLSSSFFLIAH
ncbi:protein of unknown function [Petrocella atlantisensis]|uniref:Uncharacterized protein n=1 Tax=Petrocella atlantisensis TaxID=2173034 RepID=A0A3P7NVP1_9FIRM|nr:protein of unknown function [Petrocella atlantisensis]